MVEEIELIGYCGLYCGDCIRYCSRASDLARELLCELHNTEFGKYAAIKSSSVNQLDAVKKFEHYGECCEVLEAIVALQCNSPCRIGGGCATFSCDVIVCCRKKSFDGCWQCAEFEKCQKFESLRAIHGDSPRQNLRTIRKFGLGKWVEHRYKCYIWQ
ncbi:MAG: DUF3795 domain-containing protein [Dehalococcoidia bacterium]|nr:DUF3795 domain-containing protein [Dehalococcoidia bacterium]